jgi:spermidine synthase
VKLLTNKLEALGTTAGNLYAISTVGSVFGAVLTGFILIPNIGVRKIVYLQALILIILWVAWKVLRRKYAKVLLATPFLLICILGQLHSPVLLAKNDTTIVYKANSFYGQVKVVDIKNSRWLLIDGTSHTVIDKDTGESLFEHSFYFEILHHFNQKAKDLLLLGMGGASVAKAFSEYGLAIDAVEIDPKVAEAAKKYFSAEQYIDNIFLCDARDYVMNTNKKYDLIILDTFSAAGHPFHLFTIESFKETKRILKKDGIIMVNSYGLLRGKDSLAYKSIARTLGNTFPYLKAYSLVMEPEECLGNVLLCASEEEFEFNDEIGYRNEVVKRFIKKMRRNEIKEVSTLSKEGLVLTDNYNPIEFWDINVNEATRRGIIHVFGNEVLLD